MTVSPELAPLLASEITATATSSQASASTIEQVIADLGEPNQIIPPATTPADVAARAAASGAALNLLQEAVQAGPLRREISPGLHSTTARCSRCSRR